MLTNNDLILLLTELQDDGDAEALPLIRESVGKQTVSLRALKHVNERRQLDVVSFYEHLRKNHNEKRSPLYKNIVSETDDANEILTTLHAFLLQAFLFGRKVSEETRIQFFKHVRAEEVSDVLKRYYDGFDVSSAMRMLRLIRADLMAFEYVNGRRELGE